MSHQPRRLPSLFVVLIVLALIIGVVPVPVVLAATQTLGGVAAEGNLTIMIQDSGQMNVQRYASGSWVNQIFGGSSKGSRLQINGTGYGFGYFSGNAPTQVNNYTSGNQVITIWSAGGTQLTQYTQYINGNAYYRLQWDIRNDSGSTLYDLRFFHGEDTYLLGGDNGSGFWDAANKTIGVEKTDGGGNLQRMSLQGVTTPYAYQSENYSSMKTAVDSGALTNAINPNVATDNGYALEWRLGSLGPGSTWTIIAFEKFISGAVGAVTVTAPTSTDCYIGNSCDLTFVVSNPTGASVNVNYSLSTNLPSWNPWIVSPGSSGTVGANSSQSVVVRVTVPGGTSAGTVANVTLNANDGTVTSSDTAAVNATNPPNSPPSAWGVGSSGYPNQTQSGSLSVSDAQANITGCYISSYPAHYSSVSCSASGNSGSFSYTPSANYAGSDSFNYYVCDAYGACSGAATVSISVNNRSPNAYNDSYSVNEDNTLSVSASGVMGNDSDPDGQPISAYLNSNVSHGSLTFNSNGSFSYTPSGNYNGSDSFSYYVYDGYNSSGVATVYLTINAINDAPTSAASSVTTNEDTDYAFGSGNFPFSDVDTPYQSDSLQQVQITTLESAGTLYYDADNDGVVDSGEDVTLNQSVATANLGRLKFKPALNVNGNAYDSFRFKVGDGTTYSAADYQMTINVTAINDAPVNTMPGPLTTDEDTLLSGLTFSVADVDELGATDLRFTLSSSHGNLTLPSVSGLTLISGTNNSHAMTYQGTLTAINTALNGVTYMPDLNYDLYRGAEAIMLTSNDAGHTGLGGILTDTDSVSVTVNAVNDAPVNTLPAPFSVNEDTDQTGLVFHITDDSIDSANTFEFTLSSSYGDLTLATTSGLTALDGSSGTRWMQYRGTLPNINAALASVTYRGVLNYNGPDTIVLEARDNQNTGSGSPYIDLDSVDVDVVAVNDAPINVVPGAQTIDEDGVITGLTFSTSDVDELTATDFKFTLSALHGSITITPTGLTLVSGGNGSHTLTYQGTLANVNAALNRVTYQPDADYNGSDTLTFLSDDNAHTGIPGAQTDSDPVAITINPINDAPTATDSTVATNEDTDRVFAVADFNFSDVDTPYQGDALQQVQITTLPAAGILYFDADNDSIADLGEDVVGDQIVAASNFSRLKFKPSANQNGLNYAAFRYKVNDGTVFSVSDYLMTIDVVAVNDAPINTVPGAQSVNEDTDLTGLSFSIADLDENGATDLRFTLSVLHGTLNLTPTDLTLISGSNGSASMTYEGTRTAINAALASVTYRGSADYNGSDTLTLTSNDNAHTGIGGAKSDTDTVAITINPINDAPVIESGTIAVTVTLSEDSTPTPFVLTLHADDVDIPYQADVLTWSIDTPSTHGTASAAGTGTSKSIGYTPAANYNGSDQFVVLVNDGQGGTDTIVVDVIIEPINDAPVIENGAVSVPVTMTEDSTPTAFSLTLNADDVDIPYQGDTLTWSIASQGAHGTATTSGKGTSKSIGYTPSANYNGLDSFVVQVDDGHGGTDTIIVNVTITPVNDAPVIEGGTAALTVTLSEDSTPTAFALTLNAADVDIPYQGDVLTWSIDTPSAHGTALASGVGTSKSIGYTPSANYNGLDQFVVLVDDGQGGTDTIVVDVIIEPVNDAPTSAANTVTTNEDIDYVFAATDFAFSDVDTPYQGDARQAIKITSLETAGALYLDANGDGLIDAGEDVTLNQIVAVADIPQLKFKPALNANASPYATFRFAISDGTTFSVADYALTINVLAVNDTPVNTVPAAQTLSEDGALPGLVFSLADVDELGATDLQFTLSALHGRLNLTATGLTLIAGANNSTTLTYQGTLTAINTALSNVTYTPDANYNHYAGAEAITLTTNDNGHTGLGGALTDTDAVTITVNAVNDPPVNVMPTAFSINEDTNTAPLYFHINDDAIDAASTFEFRLAASYGNPSLASLSGLTCTFATDNRWLRCTGALPDINAALNGVIYHGISNYHGPDTIVLTAWDHGNTGGGDLMDIDNVAVTVVAVNDAPINTVPGAQTVNEDTDLTGLSFSFTDVDEYSAGDLQATLAANHGSVTLGSTAGLTLISGGNGTHTVTYQGTRANLNTAFSTVTYHGDLNFSGSDTLTFTSNDNGRTGIPGAQTDVDTVAITIVNVNDAPVAVDDETSTAEDTPFSIDPLGNDGDVDTPYGDAISIVSVSAPAHGTATTNGATVIYTPTLDYFGADSFVYTIRDLAGLTSLATITLDVTPVNDAPVATDNAYTVVEDTPYTVAATGVLANDTDVDNVTLFAVKDTDPSHGTLTLNANGSFIYTPTLNYNGADSFTYHANDGALDSNIVTVDLTITGVNDGPVAVNDNDTTAEDTPLTLLVLGNDTDVDLVYGDALSVASVGTPAHGTATSNGTTLVYTPTLNYNGLDSFTYTVRDVAGLTLSGTVALTVTAVNDAPVNVVPGAQSVNEDNVLNGLVLSTSDVDEAGATDLQLTLTAQHGALTLASTGGLTGSGNGTAALAYQGALADLNAALNGVTYDSDADYFGTDTLTLIINDSGHVGAGGALSDTDVVTVTVVPINDAPVNHLPGDQVVDEDANLSGLVLSITDDAVAEATNFEFRLSASHGTVSLSSISGLSLVDGGSGTHWLRYRGTLAAINAALNGVTYRSDQDYNGPDTIVLFANDNGHTGGGALTDLDSFDLTVNPVNDAPTFTSIPVTGASQDTPYTYTITTNDVDTGDGLTITAPALPAWLTLTDNLNGTATLSGTPTNAEVGTHAITLTVTDNSAATGNQAFSIVINNVNDAPSFMSAPVLAATEDVTYTYSIITTDPDAGDVLTITATSKPAWLTLTSTGYGTASLSGVPTNAEVGSYAIALRVQDAAGLFDTQTYTVAVANVNDAPTFTSTPITTATEDVAYAYNVTTNDVDLSDVLIIAATKPAWLTLTDHGDGTASLSGTPTNADVGVHVVTLQVNDLAGATTLQSFNITVANVNDQPTFTSTPVTAATEDVAYTYNIATNDVDAGDALTITAPTKPAWLTLTDHGDGTASFAGTPTNAEVGAHAVSVQVRDIAGATSTQVFTVTVANVNDAPTFTSTPITTATEDVAYTYTIATNDVDAGDAVTLSITGKPAWLTFVDHGDGTASLNGTPLNANVGSYPLTLHVQDLAGATTNQAFTLVVVNVNDAPTFTSTPGTAATEDVPYTYNITANDVDAGDAITTSVVSKPAWLNFVAGSNGAATLSGTPTNSEVGAHAVTLQVRDNDGVSVSQSFTITVINVNDAPTFTSTPSTAATQDTAYAYAITTNDVDAGDALTITITGKPAWLTFADNGNGTASLSGTPLNANVGSYPLTLYVRDAAGATASQSFTVIVANINDAPTFTSTPVADATQDVAYAYNIIADDIDADDVLTMSIISKPAWLTFVDNGFGLATLTGTPTNANVGQYSIDLRVTDRAGATAAQTFTLTVANVNDAPTFTSTPITTATEEVAYAYNIAANDIDAGEVLTISITGQPAWLNFSDHGDGTATLSGTPVNADVGNYPIDLLTTDRDGATDAQSFTIGVANVNDAPTFTSTPITAATEDVAYSYNVTANDVDAGDAITISAPTKPAWLNFVAGPLGTATLSGTPTNANVGAHAVTIEVIDNDGVMVTQAFSITVVNVNDAPTFTSTPIIAATEDVAYAYNITTNDVDAGDAITVSAPTKPAWLNFVAGPLGTATLSGTPTNANVGAHAVTLQVRDNDGVIITQAFTITVINVNDAPTFTSTPSTAATEEVAYTYNITTNDVDAGDVITISAPTKPAWLNFVAGPLGTATLSGTPTNADVGAYAVTLHVVDNAGVIITQAFTITVANVNDMPVFTSTPITAATEDVAYTYNIAANDVDAGEVLTITLTGKPAWLTFTDHHDGTATLSGTPTNADVGSYPLTLQVKDVAGTTDTQIFTVTVVNVNDAPTFTTLPITTATQDVAYGYTIIANEMDAGDVISISALVKPAWLTLVDNGHGLAALSGLPTNAHVGAHAVTLQVRDNSNATATQSFTVTVANVNDAPVFTSTPVTTATEDIPYAYAIVVNDIDASDVVTIAIAGKPTWLTFVDHGDGTATLSGNPTDATVGSYPIVLRAADRAGVTVTQTFTLVSINVNDAPTFTTSPITAATQGAPYAYAIVTHDDDTGDALTISTLVKPAWLTLVDNGNGLANLSGTPANANVGANAVTLQVRDMAGITTTQTFTITVANVNDNPIFTSTPITAAPEDVAYLYNITVLDIDPGEVLTITISGQPAWLNFTDLHDGTATLSGTPTNANVGSYPLTLQVRDSAGVTATQAFTVIVTNVNDAPTFTSSAITAATEDVAYTYAITTTDVDAGDVITLSAPTKPTWLTFTPGANGTGALSGTPTNAEVGAHAVVLQVRDNAGATTTQAFTITVMNVNDAPTFTSTPITAATEDVAYTYNVTTSDVDAGDAITVSASTKPAWLNLVAGPNGTATLSGTPTNANVGMHAVTLQVRDSAGVSVTQSFTITVANVNDAPTFDSMPLTAATEDAPYTYSIMTSDVDAGDVITLTASIKPAWLTFTPGSSGKATLSGTPTNAEVGSHAVTLHVRDNANATTTQTFTITVANVNDAPTFTSTPITTATEDVAYTYNITASDVDAGDSLTISATTKPAWLNLVAGANGTATLSGTPTNANVGAHVVTLQVRDSAGVSVTQAFTITVANVNDAPTFTSVPITAATEDVAYAYAITTTDVDAGDAVTVSASVKPAWLNFVAGPNGTAILSGTPTNANVGSHAVTLVARDTSNVTTTQAFTVIVANVNDAPAFSSTPITTATEDALYAYSVVASDIDPGEVLTITASSKPAWLSLINPGNGTATLSGTPTNAEVGAHAVTLQVADRAGVVVTQTFTLTVANVADAPVFTSVPILQATKDVLYIYAITAVDVDAGDAIELTALAKPDWLTLIDHGNGTATLSGTPGATDAAAAPVVVQARDTTGLTATQAFTISMSMLDLELKMSASRQTVLAGDLVTYVITATNIGALPGLETVLGDELPANVTVEAVSGPGCTTTAGGVTCQLGTLQPGQSITVTITIKVLETGRTSLMNSAAVVSVSEEAHTSNNAASVIVLANPFPMFLPLIQR